MKTTSRFDRTSTLLKVVLLAGLCGGMAEIIWVQLYAFLAGQSSVEVARQVTASLLPGMAESAVAASLGVAIHLVLSVLVALAYALLVWLPFTRRRAPAVSLTVASGVLACVWAFNFLLLLPVVNATFVGLLPYSVSLGSKLLFGVAMAGVFHVGQSLHQAGRLSRALGSAHLTSHTDVTQAIKDGHNPPV
jgi:hypothetical protein